jgi:3-phosphoshikimate 1-carboxyvinyltransferase
VVDSADGQDALPLTLVASGLTGGEIAVDASVSSQFLSGLLMAAPFALAPTRLVFDKPVSRPYLDLTVETMRAFGADAMIDGQAATARAGRYEATTLEIEPDASTASYFLGQAALTGTTVRLTGLDLDRTSQGDIELVGFLEQTGCTMGRPSRWSYLGQSACTVSTST